MSEKQDMKDGCMTAILMVCVMPGLVFPIPGVLWILIDHNLPAGLTCLGISAICWILFFLITWSLNFFEKPSCCEEKRDIANKAFYETNTKKPV